MSTIKMVAQSLHLGNLMISLDLSDAYFHVRIHPDFCGFLCFRVGSCFFQFCAMPFGLASAPQMFTKLIRPISLFCGQLGIHIIF